jgi:hypothetical protein
MVLDPCRDDSTAPIRLFRTFHDPRDLVSGCHLVAIRPRVRVDKGLFKHILLDGPVTTKD